MTLLFIKRLNDTFEENAEKLIKEGKSEKEAYENEKRHHVFLPKTTRWPELSKTSENIGDKIDQICRIIERDNPDLDGVLTNTTYNDKKKYPDDSLVFVGRTFPCTPKEGRNEEFPIPKMEHSSIVGSGARMIDCGFYRNMDYLSATSIMPPSFIAKLMSS
jgi:hypothetical protein